jgi:hypothetical protein
MVPNRSRGYQVGNGGGATYCEVSSLYIKFDHTDAVTNGWGSSFNVLMNLSTSLATMTP